MTALTPDDLARIEELAEKATQEPWVLSRSKNWIAAHGDDLFRVTACDADAALVIELRNLAPALVAGVRSLEARITELEGGRIITDAHELDALPEYSVILDKHRDMWQFREGLWYSYETAPFGSERIVKKWGPVTVLHRAGADHG